MLYVQDMVNYHVRKQLEKMLSWKVGTLTNFSVSIGKSGKYMHRWINKQEWEIYLSTYFTGRISEAWEAVMTMCDLFEQVAASADWLASELAAWAPEQTGPGNIAKQLAKTMMGKTPVFYAGELTYPLAYKWKISWNESSKNLAFWGQYPEFNHNEFIGWSSHPIEKPFAVVDFRSALERPRIRERMELSDRLLSGMRPKAEVIELRGETLLQQLLWGLVLADMASIYTAVLNGVNPEPVVLVEKLKKELTPSYGDSAF